MSAPARDPDTVMTLSPAPDSPLDPHAASPEVANFIHAGPDATRPPETPEERAAEEEEAASLPDEEGHSPMLLPKIYLIRHGQSLFNAHWQAHADLPPEGQTQLNFASVAPKSSAASAATGTDGPLREGSLVGGLPLLRAQKPVRDPRLLDAPLTPKGQEQAREASRKVRGLGPMDLVLSTPLTRAIQTTLLVFRPKHNHIDWARANVPSLDQPPENELVSNVTPDPFVDHLVPIRIIPFHVENLCASCDVGLPLSVLARRFSAQPLLDFDTARQFVPDCWWYGASSGRNIGHLNIKRGAGGGAATVAAAEESTAAAGSSSAAPAAASSKPTSRPSSSGANRGSSSITLKPLNSLPAAGLTIVREQSESIEARTRQLIRYLLQLAVEHSRTECGHRPMHISLVGHCGFFARLSGHTMENCEILELEWSTILQRASVKGFLSLPAGFRHSDVSDMRKHSQLITHWLRELGAPIDNDTQPGTATTHFSADNPPSSSSTAVLFPSARAS